MDKNQPWLTLFWSTLMTLLLSCENEPQPKLPSLDEQLAEQGLTRTKLGEQLENPYSVENMASALDSLQKIFNKANPGARSLADEIDLETTDLYVRFLPTDTIQYNDMLKDTTMIYYDHPLDFEIEQQGDIFIDTTLVEGQINWQYTVVKPDFVFSDTIEYEILAELFIPENHPEFVEEEIDEESSNGRTLENKSQALLSLEMLSLSLTNNLDEEEQEKIEALQKSNGAWPASFVFGKASGLQNGPQKVIFISKIPIWTNGQWKG